MDGLVIISRCAAELGSLTSKNPTHFVDISTKSSITIKNHRRYEDMTDFAPKFNKQLLEVENRIPKSSPSKSEEFKT